jgi:exopolysaccharide biosynthesis polyprenyl glycosylphosphotransferase
MEKRLLGNREDSIYYFTTIIEIFLSVLAFYLALYIRSTFVADTFIYSREYQMLLLILITTWFFLLRTKNFEKQHRTKSYSAIFLEYSKGIALGSAVLIVAIFGFKLTTISRGFIFLFAPLNLLLLFVFRIAFYKALKYYRSIGRNQKQVVIIGDDSSVKAIDDILRHKDWGLHIVKIISNSRRIAERYKTICPVIPEKEQLHKMLELDVIDEVFYFKNTIDQQELGETIYSCEEVGVVFHMYSECWNMTGRKYHLSYFGEVPYFTFINLPSDQFSLLVKEVIDYTAAFFMLLFLSPLLLVLALLIKLDSPGPVFFSQVRSGLRGRKFRIYKFRTMIQDAEGLREKLLRQNEMDGPVFKIREDPRITRIGRFLRRTSLDELPQLINILKGEMSFIGPRPPLPQEVEQYERWHLRRLSMKPGITCIWQTMNNRNEIFFNKWMKLDLEYIDSWSLKLDFLLFLKTIRVIMSGTGR